MTQTPEIPDGATWREWGIQPSWSRVLDVASHDGGQHRWHVLDTGEPDRLGPDVATIVCVHGNPTWAYAWKSFLTRFAGRHRVVAVDQLSMGYSERVASRRYEDRVKDLGDVIDALGIDHDRPVVVAAHDWGGAIAMGWAVGHPDDVDAMVLCNTGIAVPSGRGAPKIIRLAASAPLRDLVCRRTTGFVEGTVRLSGSRISKVDRDAFRAPYRRTAHRHAIADFVGDVPLTLPHPSESALRSVADRLETLSIPVLLAWGAKDIVFDDDFAADLAARLPDTQLHRFAEANHLVMAEADVASVVETWIGDLTSHAEAKHSSDTTTAAASVARDDDRSTVFDGIERRRHDVTTAILDDATGERIDFATLATRIDRTANVLIEKGLRPGDHVAMLTTPGVDLLVAVYAVWRAGGVTVIADRGLGLRGLGAALASARPAWVVGPRKALLANSLLRWAPRARRVDVEALMSDASLTRATHVGYFPQRDALAAVLFTSGATGPAKGVRYRHGQLGAQRDALAATYGIGDDDRLVAAFAPFAIYGPSLGVPTAFVDCDVTTPGELTATALNAACERLGATMAFASPAALANVARTASSGAALTGVASLRVILSAGAPVPAETLAEIAALAGSASLHTPYGMTEALPISDIDFEQITAVEASEFARSAGVCVGRPVDAAEVMIAGLGFDALNGVPAPLPHSTMGEILVRAPWVSEGYVGRWEAQRRSRPGEQWHRTGDVGQIDPQGRLWVDGRVTHVIDSVDGPIAPVPIERAVERTLVGRGLAKPGRVGAVGVGPRGCQQLVVVLEVPKRTPEGLADAAIASLVRSSIDRPVAAVLAIHRLPVDIRHNAKIDRSAVGKWADLTLTGEVRLPRRRTR